MVRWALTLLDEMHHRKNIFVVFLRETDRAIQGEFGAPIEVNYDTTIETVVSAMIAIAHHSKLVGPNAPDLGVVSDYRFYDWDGRKLEINYTIDQISGPNVIIGFRSDSNLDEDMASIVAQNLRATVATGNRGLREHLLKSCFGRGWERGISLPAMMGNALLGSHLCSTFRSQAFWTWEQLAKARKSKVHLGEESLTDFNLLEIRTHHHRDVITKTFSKAQESRDGADWEWWFTGSTGKWIGFRLQAKVLNTGSERFEHLHYVTPSGEFQSNLLCRRALNHSPKLIPLYCLYCYWAGSYKDFCDAGGSFSHPPEAYGCALLDAHLVRGMRGSKGADSLSALLRHTTPWHTLVCCDSFGGEDLPSRVVNVWRQTIRATQGDDFDVELINEPPDYVNLLLHGELTEPPDRHLKTITVFREGEGQER